ncbi:MAG: hypothetical protein NC211_07940, partial [Alistipes senegalensis]|nr:hypothetical protein [Oxalobacter formigenes]MCM1281736.1 hypothetical protein [Alistipes senegalensis]
CISLAARQPDLFTHHDGAPCAVTSKNKACCFFFIWQKYRGDRHPGATAAYFIPTGRFLLLFSFFPFFNIFLFLPAYWCAARFLHSYLLIVKIGMIFAC